MNSKYSSKLNPRFVAFLKLEEHKKTVFKSNESRNCLFMSFISDMVCLYTGANNALDPRHHIQDHNDFTKFIENYVDNEINNR